MKIMIDNYSRAYTEIYSIIDELDSSEKAKIPTDEIIYIKEHMDNTYNFKYNSKKTLKENNVSKETAIIFVYLCKNYLIEQEKQEVLDDILELNERLVLKEIHSQYYNEIWNKEKEKIDNSKNYNEANELTIYKDIWYKKILDIIKNLLKCK